MGWVLVSDPPGSIRRCAILPGRPDVMLDEVVAYAISSQRVGRWAARIARGKRSGARKIRIADPMDAGRPREESHDSPGGTGPIEVMAQTRERHD